MCDLCDLCCVVAMVAAQPRAPVLSLAALQTWLKMDPCNHKSTSKSSAFIPFSVLPQGPT